MPEHDDDYQHDEEEFEEEIEAYCVSCREKVLIEDPTPVWTKRGAPGTSGHCEICGNSVFRMGRTEAHSKLKKPKVSGLKDTAGTSSTPWGSDSEYSTYIAYTKSDTDFANKLADDLSRIGVPAWVDPEANGNTEEVQWAGGVHPALQDCHNMVVILSEAALHSKDVEEAWGYFRQHNKPVVVAMLNRSVEVPDQLRRRPRFDFSGKEDYKLSFRQLLEALTAG